MNDNPLTAVREARQRISAAVDHDPEKLVERCREIEELYRDRVISPGSQPAEMDESVKSTEPDAKRK